jgi:hypothetical protein
MADHLGVGYHALATDTPLDLALFVLLSARMQRGARRRCRGM